MKTKPVYTDPRFADVLQHLAEPWFILESAYASLWASVTRLDVMSLDPEGDDDDNYALRYSLGNDGVACLDIKGFICRDPEWWEKKYFGVIAQQDIESELDRFATDVSARALVLNIDSPGGHAMGCPELAARVRAVNGQKPIVSFTSGYMASAAYFIGSQASAVIARPSSQVGCIGTLLSWLDVSGWYEQLGVKREVLVNDGATFKGMGLPGTSLTKEQRDFLQAQVTKMGNEFKDAVRATRGCDDDAMRGQCLPGDDGVKAKLVDQLGDFRLARRTAQFLGASNAVR